MEHGAESSGTFLQIIFWFCRRMQIKTEIYLCLICSCHVYDSHFCKRQLVVPSVSRTSRLAGNVVGCSLKFLHKSGKRQVACVRTENIKEGKEVLEWRF